MRRGDGSTMRSKGSNGNPGAARLALVLASLIWAVLVPDSSAGAQNGWLEQGRKIWEDFLGSQGGDGILSDDEIAAGLREALRVGTKRVVDRVGVRDGFNADPLVHIPLPRSLEKVQASLRGVGMSGIMDDLELRLNRAAERAAPKAKRIFLDSIRAMTIDDVRRIFNGPDDAATRYFQAKMSAPLAREMTPIVDESLSEVGAIRVYEDAVARYETIPFVPDVKADLSQYVVEKGMDGIFYYLATEEAAIRRDPVKRTTEILERVFGSRAPGG